MRLYVYAKKIYRDIVMLFKLLSLFVIKKGRKSKLFASEYFKDQTTLTKLTKKSLENFHFEQKYSIIFATKLIKSKNIFTFKKAEIEVSTR